nr:hypothetical protein PHKIIMPN_00052 [Escherichia coli]
MNAKSVYRIMSENSLLLLHDKPSRRQREHKGKRKANAVCNTCSLQTKLELLLN